MYIWVAYFVLEMMKCLSLLLFWISNQFVLRGGGGFIGLFILLYGCLLESVEWVPPSFWR